MLVSENKTNGDSDMLELQKNQAKLKEAQKTKEINSLKKIVEPLSDSTEELTDAVKELTDSIKLAKQAAFPQDGYFDKDLNKNVTESINKVFGLLQKFKQNITVDLSPVNSIAAEIKKQNESIISLLYKLSNNQSEELYKLVVAMVVKQNAFIEKGFNQIDYTKQFDEILKALNERVKELIVEHEYGVISKVIPIYKNK